MNEALDEIEINENKAGSTGLGLASSRTQLLNRFGKDATIRYRLLTKNQICTTLTMPITVLQSGDMFIWLNMQLGTSTKISSNYFEFYEILRTSIPSMSSFFQDTERYVASGDIRGLVFAAYQKHLDLELYDRHFMYNNQNYLYLPPRVGREWIAWYRKENQPICFWFYESVHGVGLFIVLYTLRCRYRQCVGCGLHEVSSETALPSQKALYSQIDCVADEFMSSGEKNLIREVVISNNGNMLDFVTMPTLSLLYIIDKCIDIFPALKRIVLESRLEYIDETHLSILQETINNKNKEIKVEIAVGLEIFDDYFRNHFYRKGISLRTLEERLEQFSRYGLAIRIYMMYKACPTMTTTSAIDDINQASFYFSELARKTNIRITMHINPTFVSQGSQLEIMYKRGEYEPPGLRDIARLLQDLKVYDDLSYYISLNDEGLSASRLDHDFYEYVQLKNAVERFNILRER